MVLTIALIIFLMVIISLLLVPIKFYVNTTTQQYYLQIMGLAKVSIEADEIQWIRLKLKVLFFSFFFYPLKAIGSRKEKIKKVNPKKKKSRNRMNYKTFIRIMKSFNVEKFYLNIDTGNCIYNANLYPLFALLNYRMEGFRINFRGNNQLQLVVKNRPIRIIKAFINL
jgi:hypothetical protein